MTADTSNASAADDPQTTQEPAPAAPNDTGNANSGSNRGGSSGVAWLALLLAILAAAAGGFAVWQLQQVQGLTTQAAGSAGQRIDRLGGELNARIDTLVRESAEQQRALGDVRVALEQAITSVADLPVRVEQVEAQIASVPGIDNRSRQEFLEAEALYYMRIGNAQALLAGEPQIAANALTLADNKLREAANPRLTGVRRQLSDDIAALRAVPELDRTGISFKLQALAGQVGSWPLRYTAPDRFNNDLPEFSDSAGPSSWERVKSIVADVFNSIVSVREIDAPPESQLGSAEQAIVIESMRAELQLARLAITSGNAELYQQALARVAELASRYFDTRSSAVGAGLDLLDELAQVEMPGPLPDASRALSLMLERSTVAAGSGPPVSQPAAAAPAPEPKPEPQPNAVQEQAPQAEAETPAGAPAP